MGSELLDKAAKAAVLLIYKELKLLISNSKSWWQVAIRKQIMCA